MKTLYDVLIVLLGVANVIQFLMSFLTKSSMRSRLKASYNNWYQVAQIADEITAHPERASLRIGIITGFADSARAEIKAYSRESFGFTPQFEHPSQGGQSSSVSSQTLWQRIKAVFKP
jgi:hypothetical protein